MLFSEPASIFFVLASIAVVIFSTILIWIGILLIRTLKNIQYISKKARTETDKIAGNVDTLLQFFRSIGMLFTRSKKTKKKK